MNLSESENLKIKKFWKFSKLIHTFVIKYESKVRNVNLEELGKLKNEVYCQ